MTNSSASPLEGPTTDAGSVAAVLGMSKSSVYAAIRENTFPFPTIKVGGRIVIPTAPIRKALGLDTPEVA